MGKSKPVMVNAVLFPTKNALTAHLREMIARYAVGVDVEGEDREFCLALFEFHPDSERKLSSGVRRVEIRLDEYVTSTFRSTGTMEQKMISVGLGALGTPYWCHDQT